MAKPVLHESKASRGSPLATEIVTGQRAVKRDFSTTQDTKHTKISDLGPGEHGGF